MKTIKSIMLLIGILISVSTNAQTSPSFEEANEANNNSFIISPRLGYDFPTFKNNTPYVKYKGGLDAGISFDYYWNWIGVGADFDYIRNKAKNTYPTDQVFDGSGNLITSFDLSEERITRFFYGLGPDFRWRNKNNKFKLELNTRVGLGHVNGGRVLLENSANGNALNFHAGYDLDFKLATKLQVRASYYFNDVIGVNAGVYYLQHYFNEERVESGFSSAHQPLKDIQGDLVFDGQPIARESCNCNIYSIGLFAGISLKIPPKKEKESKEGKQCSTCDTYALAVTARDKFTEKVIPNTHIAVKNVQGEIVKTGITNDFGVVVFEGIEPENYAIEGLLYEIALDNNSTLKSEFKANETLQKELIYSNEDFILEGKAVVCNTTEGIPGVKVTLKNKAEGVQKSTNTDENGVYILHVKKNKEYEIFGQKEMYFSQTEIVNTSDFDRNTTLFVKLEICLEKADCGGSLKLKNIKYDLDKYFIREDAKPELNRLVQFMLDNPNVKIEVASHTDSRGSASYNQSLSQNRAKAAVDYVVSQGIERYRITGIGYGEIKLLNECADGVQCSETAHQLNRRTEMKVICPENK